MAKVYLITDADLENLQKSMELWELSARNKWENANISNTPEGSILHSVRYNLIGWINDIKK